MSQGLPPYPTGWYAVGFSDELAVGGLASFAFLGREVVLFRTQAGVATLMDAYCPHLGAHLGHGGCVQGERIRCPFHGFEFDTAGACQFVPYGTKPPKAKAQVYPLKEQHGLLMAYFSPDGTPPAWEVPTLDTGGWSPLARHHWDFRGHPQETTENSVDMGHFPIIHGYSNVAELRDIVVEGPYLSTRYKMTRERAILGRAVETEFDVHVYGLGYSFVDILVPQFHWQGRLFVLATPTAGDQIRLRVAFSAHPGSFFPERIHPLLRWVPRSMVFKAAFKGTFAGICNDVSQDFEIWQNKRYLSPPMLAEGDGPVGKYRRWARQFYTEAEAQTV